MKTIFVTGTDTGVGKTTVTLLLLSQLNNRGYKTFALKPIASGCNEEGENADAILLKNSASLKDCYARVNPFTFKEPLAPHLSARKEGKTLHKNAVIRAILASIRQDADVNIIEGAGGFCVPLNERELYSDVIIQLQLPTILVVGMRLGCLNHAILTYEYMRAQGVSLIGWIANCVDKNMLCCDENIETLKRVIKEPCLGVVPYEIPPPRCNVVSPDENAWILPSAIFNNK